MSNSGKLYYYTEVAFPEIEKSRVDGMFINVTSGVIKEVAFSEMKSKNNGIDPKQVESYINIAKKLNRGFKCLEKMKKQLLLKLVRFD